MEEIRKIIREEIIRAAKIYHEEVMTYEKYLIDRRTGDCYGVRQAHPDEKLELFIRLLEEKEDGRIST